MKARTLKVVTPANHVVSLPYKVVDLNPAEYVNRTFSPDAAEHNDPLKAYPVDSVPAEFALDTKQGKKIRKLVMRGELMPFDQSTADLCGVQFSKLFFKDGEWKAKH